MAILLLCIISINLVVVDYYRFENGNIEIWYQIPISHLYSPQESSSRVHDSIFIQYSHRLNIYEEHRQDSSSLEEIKGAYITSLQYEGYFIDYLPVTLYPGKFYYELEIKTDNDTLFSEGMIEIPPDTIVLSSSDIILGKKSEQPSIFRGLNIIPSVLTEFVDYDIIFSYVEIYGLVPDSLYYTITYHIIDDKQNIVFQHGEKRLKHTYTQVDTFTVGLTNFIDGDYTFIISIYDSASNSSISSSKTFSISSLFDQAAIMQFYYDIQYLANPSEYNKFKTLSEHERKVYLKKFWAKHNYWQYEHRILEADAGFKTRLLKGRDSERGKFYIKNGPPDEIEVVTMTLWARPFEIWRYYKGGYDALFLDVKNNNNPQLMKILKPGEFTQIIEMGFKDEKNDEYWFFNMAPGTYDDGKRDAPDP